MTGMSFGWLAEAIHNLRHDLQYLPLATANLLRRAQTGWFRYGDSTFGGLWENNNSLAFSCLSEAHGRRRLGFGSRAAQEIDPMTTGTNS